MTWIRAAAAIGLLLAGLAAAFIASQIDTESAGYHCGSWADPTVSGDDLAEFRDTAGVEALEDVQDECRNGHTALKALSGLFAAGGVAASVAAWFLIPLATKRN